MSFVEKDVLLITLFADADGVNFHNAMETRVFQVFPSLKVVPLPCYAKKGKSQGFVSAEGSYADSLVTNNAVYLPFFANQTSNENPFAVFKNNTDREVIPVYNAGKIPCLKEAFAVLPGRLIKHTLQRKLCLNTLRQRVDRPHLFHSFPLWPLAFKWPLRLVFQY